MANWRDRGFVPDSDDEDNVEEEGEVQNADLVLSCGDSSIPEIGLASHQSEPRQFVEKGTFSFTDSPTTLKDQDSNDNGKSNGNVRSNNGDISFKIQSFHEADLAPNTATQRNDHATDVQVLSRSSDTSGPSTAVMLEAELKKGLQTVQGILGPFYKQGEDDTDSPLSSLPSSIASSPRATPHAMSPLQSVATPIVATALNGQAEDVGNQGFTEEPDRSSIRRSFRPRAPIQVHPYALEDARYRQTLKARGLKPVPLELIAPRPHNVSEEDSQGADTFGSSQSKNSDTQSRPPSPVSDKGDEEDSQSPVRAVRTHATLREISFGDDLPELSDILQGHVSQPLAKAPRKARQSRKPQKTATDDESRIYDLPDDEPIPRTAPPRKSPTFRIPPSPPRSRGTLSSQDVPLPEIDGFLRGDTTPALLPTPLLSSDKHGTKRAHVEVFSSSDSEQVIISDDSSASGSAAESSEDESQGVQQMRRKIRGVLPASWLKLDAKHRESNLASRHQGQSPIKSALERGIAQYVSSSTTNRERNIASRSMHADAMMYAVAESDSDGSSISPFNDLDADVQMVLEDDVVEDDTIDAMLAPRSRKARSRRTQRRLEDAWARPAATRPERLGVNPRTGRRKTAVDGSKIALGSRKRIKRRHQTPKITILDAPSFQDQKVPRFLRIAGRAEVRSGKTKTQDPSKKFFKLATTEDTLEVNKELDRFRVYRKTTAHGGGHQSEPISHNSLNPQPRCVDDTRHDFTTTSVNNASTHLTLLKQATQATLQRIQNNQARSRSLEPVLPRSRPAGPLEHFQSRRSQLNRSRSSQQLDSTTTRAEKVPTRDILEDKLPSLVRRVPRAPAVRGDAPGRSLTQDPTTSTTSDRQAKGRAPRKLAPKAINLAGDSMAHPDERTSPLMDGVQDLHIHGTPHIISQAINHPPGTAPLSGSQLSQHATTALRGLQILSSAVADTRANFGPPRSCTTITTPKSGRTLASTGWSVDVGSIIHDAFVEIASVLRSHMNARSVGPDECALLRRCVESLESVIVYFAQSLSFSGVHELEAFISSTVHDIDRLQQEIQSHNIVKSGVFATLAINRLMVISSQVASLGKSITLEGIADVKLTERQQVLASLACSKALRKETTENLFSYIAIRSGNHFVPGTRQLDVPVAEIETMVIVQQLHPGHSWIDYLKSLLSTRSGVEHTEDHPAEILAYTILILACIQSVVGIGEDMASASGASKRWASPGFSVLPTAMTDFLKSFTQAAAGSKPDNPDYAHLLKLKRFGLVAFRWCLILARSSEDDVADNLLKQIFKQYSSKSNNMLDFFSPPSTQAPSFLDRRVGISELAPEPGDTDFHLFLKLTAFTLAIHPSSIGSQDSEKLRKLKLRKLSLVFSLLPNNARDIGDGNPILIEESNPLSVQDLGAVANRYFLFSTLYHYAPVGAKPEISNVKALVELSNAHDAVCTHALRCWARTVGSTITQTAFESQLHELAVWIQDMIFSISDKLNAIPAADNQKLDGDNSRWYAFKVHQQNRATAVKRLMRITKTYADAIDLCFSEIQARYLLTGDRLPDFIRLCDGLSGFDDLMVSWIFDIIAAYLRKVSDNTLEFVKQLREYLRHILFKQLPCCRPLEDRLMISMVDVWYAIARILVVGGNNTWDDYWSVWAAYTVHRFGDVTDRAKHYRILMTSKIAVNRAFVGEHIDEFFASWLTEILGQEDDLRFEHQLTNSIMRTFPDVLALGDLRRRLADDVWSLDLTREDLIRHRLEIVRHVIRTLYELQTTKRQLSIVERRLKSHADRLLETITRSLKETWGKIEGEARQAWSEVIHAVVFELSRYSFPTFKIDPWFLDAEDLQLKDKVLHLERLFVRHSEEQPPVDDEYAVRTFRLACELAALHGTKDELIEHVATTLSASDSKYIDDKGNFLLDIPAQLRFIRAVFPAYMEVPLDAYGANVLLTPMVMGIAREVCDRLETRVDLEDQSHMEQFAEMIAVLTSAGVKALKATACHTILPDSLALRALADLVCLTATVCTRWAHLHLLFPTSAAILALQQHVQTYGLYVYECACSTLGLPCVPTDPDFWAAYPESRERHSKDYGFDLVDLESSSTEDLAALKKLAKDDLTYSYRKLWERAPSMRVGSDWRYKRAGVFESLIGPEEPPPSEVREDVKLAVEELVRALELLGIK